MLVGCALDAAYGSATAAVGLVCNTAGAVSADLRQKVGGVNPKGMQLRRGMCAVHIDDTLPSKVLHTYLGTPWRAVFLYLTWLLVRP